MFCAYPAGAWLYGPTLLPNSSISTFGKFVNFGVITSFGPFSREYDARKSLITRLLTLHASVKITLRASEAWVPVNCDCGWMGFTRGARKRSYNTRPRS